MAPIVSASSQKIFYSHFHKDRIKLITQTYWKLHWNWVISLILSLGKRLYLHIPHCQNKAKWKKKSSNANEQLSIVSLYNEMVLAKKKPSDRKNQLGDTVRRSVAFVVQMEVCFSSSLNTFQRKYLINGIKTLFCLNLVKGPLELLLFAVNSVILRYIREPFSEKEFWIHYVVS